MLPIRTELQQIAPYNAGLTLEQLHQRYRPSRIAKLGSNENPLGPSSQVMAALAPSADLLRLYPDPQGHALRQALAHHFALAPGQIVLGNGSEDLIGVICRTVVRSGDCVTTLYPSFPLHEDYALLMGGNIERLWPRDDLSIDVTQLLAAAERAPRLLMFSNPMNPLGAWLRPDAVAALIDRLSDQTLLVIDEAYAEYAEGGDYQSALKPLQASGKNWVILRTFSKAYGLAGLRIGYALTCNPQMADYLHCTRTPFNANVMAQRAAVIALSDQEHLADCVAQTQRERQRISGEIARRGYRVLPSRGNFVFFNCGADAGDFSERLLAQGVITKPWKQSGFDQYLRVSIGLEEENNHFLDALPIAP